MNESPSYLHEVIGWIYLLLTKQRSCPDAQYLDNALAEQLSAGEHPLVVAIIIQDLAWIKHMIGRRRALGPRLRLLAWEALLFSDELFRSSLQNLLSLEAYLEDNPNTYITVRISRDVPSSHSKIEYLSLSQRSSLLQTVEMEKHLRDDSSSHALSLFHVPSTNVSNNLQLKGHRLVSIGTHYLGTSSIRVYLGAL
jgi:hypothetical protein